MGVVLGFTLGALNVAMSAFAVAAYHQRAGIAVVVVLFTLLPGLVAGALLGGIGELLSRAPRMVRVPTLLVGALGITSLVAYVLEMRSPLALVWLPTIAMTLVLERCTREPVEAPLPIARAM